MRRPRFHGVNAGSEYSDEEREFLLAVERYKRERNRPFPTWVEVLRIAKALGWRKVVDENEVSGEAGGR